MSSPWCTQPLGPLRAGQPRPPSLLHPLPEAGLPCKWLAPRDSQPLLDLRCQNTAHTKGSGYAGGLHPLEEPRRKHLLRPHKHPCSGDSARLRDTAAESASVIRGSSPQAQAPLRECPTILPEQLCGDTRAAPQQPCWSQAPTLPWPRAPGA